MDDGRLEEFLTIKIKENNQELLKQMGTLIDKISVPKVSCKNDFPNFKRRSNEEQFKQNSKVLAKLEESESSLTSGNLEQAKESIMEAKDLLKYRQKLIQLADSSEMGWRTVAEYEQNPIADDSDDEKRIFKAEARATRKARSDKSKRGRGRLNPYRKTPEASTSTVNTYRPPNLQAQRQRPGLCFICGKQGHWKAECGVNTSTSNNKISSSCTFIDICSRDSKRTGTISVHNTGSKLIGKESDKSSGLIEQPSELISPVGSLRKCAGHWKRFSKDTYIIDVIENGYKLPFKTIPHSVYLKNNKSARDNPSFVSNEIESLLKKGIISQVSLKPYIVNPLTVAYNQVGKPRLVLDCRHINRHLHLFKVKFEDISIAETLFEKGSYLFTFDLKSAYFHVEIFEDHKSFLGFSWPDNGEPKFYVYNCLAFGLATAGHIFTKVLRVVVKFWRDEGFRVITFLDDGIGGDKDFQKAQFCSTFVQDSLSDFGFLLAQEKCNWQPNRVVSWLGHVISYEINVLFISDERIRRLEFAIDSLIFQAQKDCNLVPVKFVASVTGMIVSISRDMGQSFAYI